MSYPHNISHVIILETVVGLTVSIFLFVLQPLGDLLLSILSKFFSLSGTIYVNYLYSDIGVTSSCYLVSYVYSVIVIGLLLYSFYAYINYSDSLQKKPHEPPHEPGQVGEPTSKGHVLTFRILISLTILLILAIPFTKALYKNEAAIFIERSIDIIAPCIEEKRVLELRGEYRGIDNFEKFKSLTDTLRVLAKDSNDPKNLSKCPSGYDVSLPEFKLQ